MYHRRKPVLPSLRLDFLEREPDDDLARARAGLKPIYKAATADEAQRQLNQFEASGQNILRSHGCGGINGNE